MRGRALWNFPAFDAAADCMRAMGWEVVSPAEIDRALGIVETDYPNLPSWWTLADAMRRDLAAICASDAICLLPGWEHSEGAARELRVALDCGLGLYVIDGEDLRPLAPCDARAILDGRPAPTDSGETCVIDPDTGAAKGQKLARFDLIPPGPLMALAEHFGRGARKYAERNWERGSAWSLNFAAMQRHAWQWWQGEDIDAETGSPHLTAVAWHAFALQEFAATHPEKDDRPWKDRHDPESP